MAQNRTKIQRLDTKSKEMVIEIKGNGPKQQSKSGKVRRLNGMREVGYCMSSEADNERGYREPGML